jgi:hypothetical protein
VEGWSRDASEDVARELERHLAAETGEIPPAPQDFIELQLGPPVGVQLNLPLRAFSHA